MSAFKCWIAVDGYKIGVTECWRAPFLRGKAVSDHFVAMSTRPCVLWRNQRKRSTLKTRFHLKFELDKIVSDN
eukprot:scaffold3034_cov173-Amphora_coffeaeformis.AAC.1